MVNIQLNDLRIGSISQSSGLFSGDNKQTGWSHHSKTNEGFGKLDGKDNEAGHNTHIVIDNDWLDLIQAKDGKR